MTHEIKRGSQKGGHPVADAQARSEEEKVKAVVSPKVEPKRPAPKRKKVKDKVKVK